MALLRAIGLMSGTSLDGVDAALIETDGESAVRPGPSLVNLYASADDAKCSRIGKSFGAGASRRYLQESGTPDDWMRGPEGTPPDGPGDVG